MIPNRSGVRKTEHVVTGDTVVLRRGKEKGKRGVVKVRASRRTAWPSVEGLNVVKRHTKARSPPVLAQGGGIIEKESADPTQRAAW